MAIYSSFLLESAEIERCVEDGSVVSSRQLSYNILMIDRLPIFESNPSVLSRFLEVADLGSFRRSKKISIAEHQNIKIVSFSRIDQNRPVETIQKEQKPRQNQRMRRSLKANPAAQTGVDSFCYKRSIAQPEKQSAQRKPIFSTEKIENSNRKFMLPQLYQYTPSQKSKIEIRSIISAKESLDLSFNHEEFMNSHHVVEHKDDTIISQPPLLQSAIQSSIFRTEPLVKPEKEQRSTVQVQVLGIMGILIAYCLYVGFR